MEPVITEDIADINIRTNTLSIILSSIVQSNLKNKEDHVHKINKLASKVLEEWEDRLNFYSFCVGGIAESQLPEEEKKRWISEITIDSIIPIAFLTKISVKKIKCS